MSRILGLCGWLALLAGPPSQAEIFYANYHSDMVDITPGDGVCEIATGNGVCTLRAAIQESNALPGEDTVVLQIGTYALTIAGSGEDAAASGDLDVTEDLILRGTGRFDSVLDGEALGDRVLQVLTGVRVDLQALTIRNGRAAADLADGGGIHNAGTLQMNNVYVIDGEAINGGGIYNAGNLDISQSAIFANTAVDGGGLYTSGSVLLVNSTLGENSANGDGGGIFALAGDVDLLHVTIAHNDAFNGGGINNGGAVMGLGNTLISNNTAVISGGECVGAMAVRGRNVVFNTSACVLSGLVAGVITGESPVLQATSYYYFLPDNYFGSPAIDSGDADICAPVDQLGKLRPLDGNGNGTEICDIGAIEVDDFMADWYGAYGDYYCFIATAAYGTPMAKEVGYLRAFRDRYLKPNAVGRALVGLYYRYSPPLASRLGRHEGWRAAVRVGLQPMIRLSKLLLDRVDTVQGGAGRGLFNAESGKWIPVTKL